MKKSIENYPFVKILENHVMGKKHENPRIWFTYEICGETYLRWDYDQYIDDAIELASKWKPEERTYKRITHLRNWLRENTQHCHNLHFNNIRTMSGCKKFIDRLIDNEYYHYDAADKDQVIMELKKQNEIIFLS